MWRPLLSVITTSSSVISRAFSALSVHSKLGHHPHPQATFVPNFVSVAASIAELAHGEKLNQFNQFNHPAYLMPWELQEKNRTAIRLKILIAIKRVIKIFNRDYLQLITTEQETQVCGTE